MNIVSEWIRRVLTDSQAVVLVVLLLTGLGVIMFMGEMLAPVLAGLVIAYLLEGLVRYLERWRFPRMIAVMIVFAMFSALLALLMLGLLPLLSRQIYQLAQELPNMLIKGQEMLMELPERYPAFIGEQQVNEFIAKSASRERSPRRRVTWALWGQSLKRSTA
jgi:putative permease